MPKKAIGTPLTEYTITLREASLALCMPQDVVIKCVGRVARRNGGIKLDCKIIKGEPFFRQADIDEYIQDLDKPWIDGNDEPRPGIPDYFQLALRLETELMCGVCGSPFAKEFAHVIPWDECKHNHPWNLLTTCTKCHNNYDVAKIISREEMIRAKTHAQAVYRNNLRYLVGENKLLSYLKSFEFPINGTVATGIDFLLSTIVPGQSYLQVTKIRGVELFSMLGNGAMESSEAVSLFRLMELSLSHLENSRFLEPFWHKLAERIYTYPHFYPWQIIEIGPTGGRLFEILFADAKDYIDPSKYPAFKNETPQEVFKHVTEAVQAEQERRDNRDGAMEEESLHDFRT